MRGVSEGWCAGPVGHVMVTALRRMGGLPAADSARAFISFPRAASFPDSSAPLTVNLAYMLRIHPARLLDFHCTSSGISTILSSAP